MTFRHLARSLRKTIKRSSRINLAERGRLLMNDFDSWLQTQDQTKTFDVDTFMSERQTPAPQRERLRTALLRERRRSALPPPQPQTETEWRGTYTPDYPDPALTESLDQQARRSASMRQRRIQEFSAKPLVSQWGERASDAMARAGSVLTDVGLAELPRQAVRAIAKTKTGRAMSNRFDAWRAERAKELEERRQSRPSSLATQVGEGIIEAAPIAGAVALTGGGGALRTMATGAALTASGIPAQNWAPKYPNEGRIRRFNSMLAKYGPAVEKSEAWRSATADEKRRAADLFLQFAAQPNTSAGMFDPDYLFATIRGMK